MRNAGFSIVANLFRRRPTTTVLFVTRRCSLSCKMCFCEAREPADELHPEEVARLARSLPPQVYVMFTGGEPFLRSDLPDLTAPFYDRGARNLHIATNAFHMERTLAGVEAIAGHARRARVIVVVSIDGPAALHDDIRGLPGAHARTVATTRALLERKRRHANLSVLANVTFSAFNQEHWRETIDFLRDDLGVDAVNIGLVRGRTRRPEATNVDLERYAEAQRYLLRGNRRRYFSPVLERLCRFKQVDQFETLVRIAQGDPPRHYACGAGRVFHVITETGDVHACEMRGSSIGNLRDVDMDFMRIWRSRAADVERSDIARRACLCTYECAMGPSIATSFVTLPRLARFLWRGEFKGGEQHGSDA